MSLETFQPASEEGMESLSPEQIAEDRIAIGALEQQFSDSSPLLIDEVGVPLQKIPAPEDQLRGITATSMSTTNPSEED